MWAREHCHVRDDINRFGNGRNDVQMRRATGSRARWAGAIAAALAVVLTASVSTASARSDASIRLKIGALVPNTGTSSAYGPATEKGVRMGVSQLNAAAKAAGVDFEASVEAVDNQSDP